MCADRSIRSRLGAGGLHSLPTGPALCARFQSSLPSRQREHVRYHHQLQSHGSRQAVLCALLSSAHTVAVAASSDSLRTFFAGLTVVCVPLSMLSRGSWNRLHRSPGCVYLGSAATHQATWISALQAPIVDSSCHRSPRASPHSRWAAYSTEIAQIRCQISGWLPRSSSTAAKDPHWA